MCRDLSSRGYSSCAIATVAAASTPAATAACASLIVSSASAISDQLSAATGRRNTAASRALRTARYGPYRAKLFQVVPSIA